MPVLRTNFNWGRLLRPLSLSLSLLLAACATPPQAPAPQAVPAAPEASSAEQDSLRRLLALRARLDAVAAPLLMSNVQLCKRHKRFILGFTARNKYSYSPELTLAAQTAIRLDEQLTVTRVLDGSGAARADVRRGDKLVAVDGKPIPQGRDIENETAKIFSALMQTGSSVNLTVTRDGKNMTLAISPTLVCASIIELGNNDNVIAYSDGQRVLVSRGMMNFTQSDEELAIVLAKEIAHNALAHTSRQRNSASTNGTVSAIIDNLRQVRPDMSNLRGTGGVQAFSGEADVTADTLSLYMLARAGYDVGNVPKFWQRLAIQYPETVLNGYTAIHPSTSYRLSVMERTVAEAKAKQAEKKPLFP